MLTLRVGGSPGMTRKVNTMSKKALILATALSGLAISVPAASAQSGSYWSYDGRTSYASYQACENARQTRTLGGAAVGGLLGAGAGSLAGGNDTRNAVVGAAIGAVAGGIVGRNQVQCQQYGASSGSNYGGSYNTGYNNTTYSGSPYYGSSNTSGYYNTQPAYSGGSGYYSTQPTYSGNSGYYNTGATYSHRPTYSHGSTSGYSNQYPSRTYTTTTTRSTGYSSGGHTSTPYYGSSNSGYYTTQPGRTYTTSTPYYGSSSGGYTTSTPYYGSSSNSGYYSSGHGSTQGYAASNSYWTHDGRTTYGSYEACEQARRNRTLASGGLGALAGAGLGTLAGGDDGRNAIYGAVIGGAAGAYRGSRSIQCHRAGSVYSR